MYKHIHEGTHQRIRYYTKLAKRNSYSTIVHHESLRMRAVRVASAQDYAYATRALYRVPLLLRARSCAHVQYVIHDRSRQCACACKYVCVGCVYVYEHTCARLSATCCLSHVHVYLYLRVVLLACARVGDRV